MTKKPMLDIPFVVIDASGKLGLNGGAFDGNLIAFGRFDACLNIEAQEESFSIWNNTLLNITQPAFKGQYFLTNILLVPTGAEVKYQHSALVFQPSALESATKNMKRHIDYGIGHSLQSDLMLVSIIFLFHNK
jgi:hypothetical protein